MDKVPILVPIGTALLGLRVWQSIDWELPGGTKDDQAGTRLL